MNDTADSFSCSLSRLFFSMLYISAFTFGGGYVIVTLMKEKFVDKLGWLSEQEMLDMTALAQSSPGAIAVNAAILIGWRVRGFAGMFVSVAATILPPLVIISVISLFYAAFAANPYVAALLHGMQAGVAAVIANVVLNTGRNVLKQHSLFHNAIMVCAFIAAYFLGVHVALIILACGVAGSARVLHLHRKGGKKP